MALMGTSGLIWSVTHHPCWVCNFSGIYSLKLLKTGEAESGGSASHAGGSGGRVKGLALCRLRASPAPDRGGVPVSLIHVRNGTICAECSPGVDLGVTAVVVLTDPLRMAEGSSVNTCMHA